MPMPRPGQIVLQENEVFWQGEDGAWNLKDASTIGFSEEREALFRSLQDSRRDKNGKLPWDQRDSETLLPSVADTDMVG